MMEFVVNFILSTILKSDLTVSVLCLAVFYSALTCLEFAKILYNSSHVSYQDRLQYLAELTTLAGAEIKPRTIKVCSGDQPHEADVALTNIQGNLGNFTALGLDAEMERRPYRYPKVHLVQFANKDGDCVLIRTFSMPTIPKVLARLLCNNDIWKVGIGVYNDAYYLLQDYAGQFEIRGTFDLRYLAYYFSIPERGLKKLANSLLKMEFYSHDGLAWASDELTPSQIMYAALDAYVGILLFEKFYVMHSQKTHGCTADLDQRTQADTLQAFYNAWEHKKSKQFRDDYSSMLYYYTSLFKGVFGLQ